MHIIVSILAYFLLMQSFLPFICLFYTFIFPGNGSFFVEHLIFFLGWQTLNFALLNVEFCFILLNRIGNVFQLIYLQVSVIVLWHVLYPIKGRPLLWRSFALLRRCALSEVSTEYLCVSKSFSMLADGNPN